MEQVSVVEFVVSALVEYPEDIRIDEIQHEDGSILELRVHDEDLGKIIGKKGRIAKSLRTLMQACDSKARNVQLEIID